MHARRPTNVHVLLPAHTLVVAVEVLSTESAEVGSWQPLLHAATPPRTDTYPHVHARAYAHTSTDANTHTHAYTQTHTYIYVFHHDDPVTVGGFRMRERVYTVRNLDWRAGKIRSQGRIGGTRGQSAFVSNRIPHRQLIHCPLQKWRSIVNEAWCAHT
eukprot:GHVU01025892.1.p3 GENE.GHVU01025892.1~~GHVU01025892.1.p3  ORF type:complete len:158 (-),score=2.60 GHVU01025892.1:401-874(-)